jgi:hypothetical protein
VKDSTFWDVTFARALTIYANVIFVILWVGFITALLVDRAWLDALWNWAQALPLIPRVIVWVLFLPIMVGLWMWESDWSTFWRWVGFAGIVGWTLLAIRSIFENFR